jgi:hypothetical protein
MLLISGISAAAAWGLAPDGDRGRLALNAGVGSFLAWAIGRELDPDRPNAAAVAAVLAGITIITVGEALLFPTVLALLAVRVLHRSTGLPPTLFDLIALPGAAYAGASSTIGWTAGLALALAVARDHRLPEPAPRRQLAAAFFIASAATAGILISGSPGDWAAPAVGQAIVLALGVFAGLSMRIYEPRSVADHTGGLVIARRLQSARVGGIGVGLLAAAVGGGAGIAALIPLWAAIVGVAAWDRIGSDQVSYPERTS